MRYLPFPDEPLALSNFDLGRRLLDSFIHEQARDLELPVEEIPDAFAERVRQHILTFDAENAETVVVEKALRKAALGEYEFAGRILRNYMVTGAVALKFVPIGINRSRQAAKFGRAGAQENKKEGDFNRQTVLEAATAILKGRTRKPTDRELAKLIVEKSNLRLGTVRTHLAFLRKKRILA